MRYFDINTLARPRPNRFPGLRFHDIQPARPKLDVLTIKGVTFSFKSTPSAPGSFPIGASLNYDLNCNTPVKSLVQALTVNNKNVGRILNRTKEKLKKNLQGVDKRASRVLDKDVLLLVKSLHQNSN